MDPAGGPALGELRALYALLDGVHPAPPTAVVVEPQDVPAGERELLAHEEHMTVAHEKRYGEPVGVRVLQPVERGSVYTRKSLLYLPSSGQVVQFCIMSIDFAFSGPGVREAVVEGRTPLGRVLIEHGLLRRISYRALLKIEPDEEIRGVFGLDAPRPVYGRLATIFVNDRPAVRLLEVVTPQ